MADYFHDPFFGLYFPNGYFGPQSEANPGAMSASLSGAGSLSATLTGVAAVAEEGGHGAGSGSDLYYEHLLRKKRIAYRAAKEAAKKALVAASKGNRRPATLAAEAVAGAVREIPDTAAFETVQVMLRAAQSLLERQASVIDALKRIIEAAEQYEADLAADEDDAIVAILLAA